MILRFSGTKWSVFIVSRYWGPFIHLYLFTLVDSYRVLVRLQCSGGDQEGSMCLVEAPEEEAKGVAIGQSVLGRVQVDRSMRWSQLSSTLSNTFTSYLQTLCGESPLAREEGNQALLGLGPGSMASILIGEDRRCFYLTCKASILPR